MSGRETKREDLFGFFWKSLPHDGHFAGGRHHLGCGFFRCFLLLEIDFPDDRQMSRYPLSLAEIAGLSESECAA